MRYTYLLKKKHFDSALTLKVRRTTILVPKALIFHLLTMQHCKPFPVLRVKMHLLAPLLPLEPVIPDSEIRLFSLIIDLKQSSLPLILILLVLNQ
jgi:hypothetical protein